MRTTENVSQQTDAAMGGTNWDDGRDHGDGMGGWDTRPGFTSVVLGPGEGFTRPLEPGWPHPERHPCQRNARGLCQHCPDRLRKSA